MAATQAKPRKKPTRARPKAKVEPEPGEPKQDAEVANLQLRQEALDQVRKIYEEQLTDEMGKLHNQFVAFISESRVPLPQVLIVLEILKAETIEIARHKYMGG